MWNMKITQIQQKVQDILDDLRSLDQTAMRFNEELTAVIARVVDLKEDLKDVDRCEVCHDVFNN